MKKLLLSTVITLLCCTLWGQAYYGDLVKMENFDNQTNFNASWTVVNTVVDSQVALQFQNPTSGDFTTIDPTNVTSAYFRFGSGDKAMITMTSKDINLAGKNDIAIGFYGKSMYSLYSWNNILFKFEVSKDGGTTWELLFNSENDSRNGQELANQWYLYKYFLPAEYNGKTIKARFIMDAAAYSGWSNDVYFDNFFVSERYGVDPIITEINYSTNNSVPTKGGFTMQPVKVSFKNGGKNPITSITAKYQVNDGTIVSETYNPATAIATNGTGEYTFNQKADLSILRQKYTIKVWIEMINDGDLKNNELIGYAENITTALPYTPRFLWNEGGTGYIGNDEWITVNKGGGANWRQDNQFGIHYWYIINGVENTNTYLVTRPMYFESNKTYEIKFDAFTNSSATATEKLNSLKVYASDNIELTGMTELYSNSAIDNTNARDKFARYKATKTGPQYFVFYCNSPLTADELRLINIYIVESPAIDAGISSLVSPTINKWEYTTNEEVKVKIRNFGTNAIAANAVQVKMQLNDGTVVTETVSAAIAAASEITHTFATKIDPSNQNKAQILKVWTVLSGDMNADNDVKEYKIESIVTGVPYIPTEGADFTYNWKIEDINNDKQTFVLVDDFTLKLYAFRYGGYSGYPQTIIMSSNDAVYSRPIRLAGGTKYRVAYQARVERNSMPLRLDLYKVEGETKTLINSISTVTVDNTTFAVRDASFDIAADGIYEVAFVVEYAEAINFRIFFGDFKLTKVFDYDLLAVESLLSGTSISCYNNLPVGLLVKNNGSQTVNSFKIKATSPSLGTKEQTFDVALASGESKACYFNENILFNGTGNEDFTLSVVLDNDKDLSNNSIVSSIEYIDNPEIPYFCALNTSMDYLTVNNNKDNYKFKRFSSGSGMSAVKGVEYIGSADVEADDEVITECFSLEAGKVYSISLYHAVATAQDIASLDISVYNFATSTKIDVAYLKSLTNTTRTEFYGYFTVPTNGDYAVRFKACDKTTSLRFINNLYVEEVEDNIKPDIEVLSITVPSTDAIFTNSETVTVSFKNVSSSNLSSIPFTLDVNGVKYYATYLSAIYEDEDATVDFVNVDLFTPGDYTLTATANVSADATPANNTVTKAIKSLPIIDVTMVSIDKPKSGALSAEQEVVITIKNSGKGILTNIPVSFTVSNSAKSTITGNVAGPLNAGETIQYTFPQTVNMYEEMTYNISATCTIAGDINTDDNTISTSVVCSQEPFDAGVTAILTPVDGLLTATETVKIKVKNYSTVDLFDIPVKATVGTQTITGSVAKITKGQEVEYTFAQTIDLSAYGLYTITAATTLESDVNTSNDSFSKEVKSYKIDVGITEILSPVSGDNMGTEQVKVVVKNFGDVAVSGIPVRYKVTTMAMQGTVNQEIAPGATVEFTFSSTYDFSDYKTYTITAYTEYGQDMDNTNNQAVKEVTNTKKAIDIAANAIVAPVSGILTATEKITVTIKNVGDAEVKDIPVECDVEGVVAKETISGKLAVGAEMNYTFTKTYDMSVSGKYNVKVTVKMPGDGNKDNDVVTAVIENNVGVNDLDSNIDLSIYPNPVKDILHVDGIYESLEVYNSSGKLIMTVNGESTIDVSNIASGVYMLKAYNKGAFRTYKIVK